MHILAVLFLAAAAFISYTPQASAADSNHLNIRQSEEMRWNAYMVMYDKGTGNKIYEWREKHGLDGSSPNKGAYVWWSWNPGSNPANVGIEVSIDHIVDTWIEVPYRNCLGNYCVDRSRWEKRTHRETFKAHLDPRKSYCYTLSPGGLKEWC